MTPVEEGALALCLAAACTPVAGLVLGRMGVLDHPNDRSSHAAPIVRGAGVAPALGCIIIALVFGRQLADFRWGLLSVAAGLLLLGLSEDVVGVPIALRLVLQAGVAAAGLIWLGRGVSGSELWIVAFSVFAVFWTVAFVNAFNFMDGLNGISVAQVVVACTTWAVLGGTRHVPALQAVGLVGAAAAVGFAPFNFPRPRVFLGDAGSYFFGGWLAAGALIGLRTGVPLVAMGAPLALYLADTSLTLVRRLRRGDAWYRPHRDHIYQRLNRLGWSHARVTLTVGALQVVCGACGIAYAAARSSLLAVPVVALVAVVCTYAILPRAVATAVPGSAGWQPRISGEGSTRTR